MVKLQREQVGVEMLKVVTMKRRAKVVTEVVRVVEGYKLQSTLTVGTREIKMVSADTWINVMGADRAALSWLELME